MPVIRHLSSVCLYLPRPTTGLFIASRDVRCKSMQAVQFTDRHAPSTTTWAAFPKQCMASAAARKVAAAGQISQLCDIYSLAQEKMSQPNQRSATERSACADLPTCLTRNSRELSIVLVAVIAKLLLAAPRPRAKTLELLDQDGIYRSLARW